jgi:hypothetical protein
VPVLDELGTGKAGFGSVWIVVAVRARAVVGLADCKSAIQQTKCLRYIAEWIPFVHWKVMRS